ncbi:hypothetical protein LTR08_000298 [Meristemomyces frigidus]|nr:hypothetical protein LTR08_000298 [Meristemomyces frigidus]
MADRRGILIPLIILGFLFFSPDPGRPAAGRFNERPRVEDVVAEEQRSLWTLQNSTYDALGRGEDERRLNLTGLEPDRGYAWNALPTVKARAQEQLEYALGDAGKQALEQGRSVSGEVGLYQNVTGYVHGKWVRSKVQESVAIPQLNLSNYAPQDPFGLVRPTPFARNITGNEGDVRLRLREKDPAQYGGPFYGVNITMISAELTLQDNESGSEEELQVRGVYYSDFGQAVMTTTSDKFAGIFMLPHFALSERAFPAAKSLLNESIPRTIKRQLQGTLDQINPWTPNVNGLPTSPFDPPSCELIIYLQQLPPTGTTAAAYTTSLLSFLERELRFPTGAFLPPAPELRFSMLVFSPDCGYVLESKGEPDYVPSEGKQLTGPKIEVLYKNGRHHLTIFTLTLLAQIFLLLRQMREASTPSTRSRISFYTVAMLTYGDGFVMMTFLMGSLFIPGLWVNLSGTAFLAFISASFFGMRFLLDIWTGQAPERAQQAREEAEEERLRLERVRAHLVRIRAEREARVAVAAEQPDTADANVVATPPPPPLPRVAVTTQTMPDSLLLPATTQRPTDTGATPVFMPSDQQGLEPIAQPQGALDQLLTAPEARLASFGSLYTRFYLLLLGTLFISLNAASWPAGPRRFYFTTLSLAYLSFWLPQILRNVQRNCRHALNSEFVVGQSILRLVPFAYFYGYKHNVLFAAQDFYGLSLLVIWLWIQVVVLASQELLGPRWFIRKDWAPPAYDYHPVLREDEEGATMPLGLSEARAADVSAPTSPLVDRRASLGSLPTARRSSLPEKAKAKGRRVFDCAIASKISRCQSSKLEDRAMLVVWEAWVFGGVDEVSAAMSGL